MTKGREHTRRFETLQQQILQDYPGVRERSAEQAAAATFVAAVRRELAEARRHRGLKQSEVAERLGVSQPVISRLEAEQAGDIGLETLHRYAAACGLQPEVRFSARAGDHSTAGEAEGVSGPTPRITGRAIDRMSRPAGRTAPSSSPLAAVACIETHYKLALTYAAAALRDATEIDAAAHPTIRHLAELMEAMAGEQQA